MPEPSAQAPVCGHHRQPPPFASGTGPGAAALHPQAPNQLWSGDITDIAIAIAEGGLYLAAVIDLFSRQVVGWSLQPHMQADLVKDARAMAWWRQRSTNLAAPLVHNIGVDAVRQSNTGHRCTRLGALSEDLLLELGVVPPTGLLLGFIHGVHLPRLVDTIVAA